LKSYQYNTSITLHHTCDWSYNNPRTNLKILCKSGLRIASGQLADALTRWQQFSTWNDGMAAILIMWRQIKNVTLAIDVYYLKNNPVKFYADQIRNNGELGVFEENRLRRKHKSTSDMIW